MTEQLWFYELLMEEFGPVPAVEIQQLLNDGMLSATDRVRPESSDRWKNIADTPALRDLSSSVAAPEGSSSLGRNVDDETSDDRHSHLDINAINLERNADVDNRHSDLDINAFNLQGNSEEPDRNSDLDIDAFNIAGDTDSRVRADSGRRAPPPFEPLTELDTTPPANYFVKSFGHILGPMPNADLIEMARSGAFSQGDEIRLGTDGQWIAIEVAPDLARLISGQEVQEPSSTDAERPSKTADTPAPAPTKKKKARTSKSPAAGKRRKKVVKEDEFLKEIFNELFDENGQVRPEVKRSPDGAVAATNSGVSQSTSAAPAMGTPAMGAPAMGAPAMGAPASAAIGAGTAIPTQGVPVAADSGVPQGDSGQSDAARSSMGSPGYSAGMSPPAAPPPARKPTPKKSSSGGGSGGFTMPEPKVLGIAGGGLALVLLLVGGFMGVIPLPGFGVNPDTFFTEFVADWEKMKSAKGDEWKSYKDRYESRALQLTRDLNSKAANDPNAKKQQKAALLMVQLLRKPETDQEGRDKLYDDFQKMLAGD